MSLISLIWLLNVYSSGFSCRRILMRINIWKIFKSFVWLQKVVSKQEMFATTAYPSTLHKIRQSVIDVLICRSNGPFISELRVLQYTVLQYTPNVMLMVKTLVCDTNSLCLWEQQGTLYSQAFTKKVPAFDDGFWYRIVGIRIGVLWPLNTD